MAPREGEKKEITLVRKKLAENFTTVIHLFQQW